MKAAYDAEYRKKNQAILKAKKAAYFQRTYDPSKAAVERKRRSAQHNEYCRQPSYRKYKQAYDKKRRAEIQFGEFAEAFLVLQKVESEILSRSSRYEIGKQNAVINKITKRKRDYERITGQKSIRS